MREGEAGGRRREAERLEERKKERKKKEGKRGRGVVTCALSYNRGSRPGICGRSGDRMRCGTTRRL